MTELCTSGFANPIGFRADIEPGRLALTWKAPSAVLARAALVLGAGWAAAAARLALDRAHSWTVAALCLGFFWASLRVVGAAWRRRSRLSGLELTRVALRTPERVVATRTIVAFEIWPPEDAQVSPRSPRQVRVIRASQSALPVAGGLSRSEARYLSRQLNRALSEVCDVEG